MACDGALVTNWYGAVNLGTRKFPTAQTQVASGYFGVLPNWYTTTDPF